MRVLVVEDHPTLARSISEGLREEGYAVDLATSGVDADHLVGGTDYDCVLLDVMLPDKSGFDVLSAMRKRGNRSPVLCLTARDAVADRVHGLDLGADDYLVKPFEWDELLARVRALVRRAHGATTTVVTIGDLEIDPRGRTVRRGTAPVTLTAREFALLEYLAARAGQVVTRTDIWEHLYDMNDESTSNVVDVYIGYLRAKIDKPFPDRPRLIHTRRGQGYVLSAAEEPTVPPPPGVAGAAAASSSPAGGDTP